MPFRIVPFVETDKIFVTVMIAMAGLVPPAAAEDVGVRLERAAQVLSKLAESKDLARADCVVSVPGFYRGAAIQGEIFEDGLLLEVSFGRGFITCRDGDAWSAPGAITLEGGSLTVQIGEKLDVVILSMNKLLRSNVLSDEFTIGSPGVTADARLQLLLPGSSTRRFAGFDLSGAVLKSDDAVNRKIYRRAIKNSEIVHQGTAIPPVAQALISKIASLTSSPFRSADGASQLACISKSA